MLAHFIGRLINVTHANVTDFHLIGHSLGAHISGYAGSRFANPKIAKITALDPAGPAFQADNANSRLDRTDASYVVAIHTNAGNGIYEG